VAHTFSPDPAGSYLYTALITNDASVFYLFVLSAQALPILYRTKDPGTEKTILLRFESPVINSLRLFNFSPRPRANDLRGSQFKAYCLNIIGILGLLKKLQNIV